MNCTRCRKPDEGPLRFLHRPDIRGLLQRQWYSKNNLVFRQDQPAEGAYIVLSGRLRLYLKSNRRRISVGTAIAGWVLGAGETLQSSSYLFCAETEEETELEFLAREPLLALLRRNPEWSVSLLAIVAEQSNELMVQLLEAR